MKKKAQQETLVDLPISLSVGGVLHGFRSMQYNLVVSTNEGAIRMLKRPGFQIVGILPCAFCDFDQGYVDAHVTYK